MGNSTATSQDGDPDIDTMPLLAWSLKQAQSFRELRADGKDSSFVKFMIAWQAFFYFPILLLARISWLNESFKTAFGLGASTENARRTRTQRLAIPPTRESSSHLTSQLGTVPIPRGKSSRRLIFNFFPASFVNSCKKALPSYSLSSKRKMLRSTCSRPSHNTH